MKNRNMALVACAGLCASAWAQIGTGTWKWEVSADGGATWGSGLVEVPPDQQDVRVRAVAAWSADAGGWYARAHFDIVWDSRAGDADLVTYIERYRPFEGFAQNLEWRRFGAVIKIDDRRDTLPPGEGEFGVYSAQLPPGFGIPSTANPAALMEFRIALDVTPGDRVVSSIFLPVLPHGNTTDRVFAVYTTREGLTNFPLITIHNATVRVVPSPGGACTLLATALLTRRRTRTRQS